jgi:hypothetical protein
MESGSSDTSAGALPAQSAATRLLEGVARTLFDEITEMPIELRGQAAARVETNPDGSRWAEQPIQIDVRIRSRANATSAKI